MARPNKDEDNAATVGADVVDANDPRFKTSAKKGVMAFRNTEVAPLQVPEVDINNAPLGTHGKLEIVKDAGGSAMQLTDSDNEIVA